MNMRAIKQLNLDYKVRKVYEESIKAQCNLTRPCFFSGFHVMAILMRVLGLGGVQLV